MNRRQGLLVGALTVTVALVALGPADEELAVPLASSGRPSGSAPDASKRLSAERSADMEIRTLRPRPAAESGMSGGLFAATVPAAPQVRVVPTEAPPPPPAAPTAPPAPFVVLGKTISEGRVEVILGKGDAVIIAREKAVIAGEWRVEQIRPPQMRLTYLPLQQEQLMSIGVFE